MRVESFVQRSRDEHSGADRDGLGTGSRPRQPPDEAGGRSDQEGEDADALDGQCTTCTIQITPNIPTEPIT